MAEDPPSLDAIEAEPAPLVDDFGIEFDEEAFFAAESKRLELQSRAQDIALRGKFSKQIFWLIVVWLLIVLGIVISDGFHSVDSHSFQLSDNVLLALIGSTTANVLGVFIIVVHYLFPESKS